MRRLLIFAVLSLAPTAHAQAIQSKACSIDAATGRCAPVHLDKPFTQGNTGIIVGFEGCDFSLPWPEVVACNSISDNCGNVWIHAINVEYYGYSPLWYALDLKGCDATIRFAPHTNRMAIVAEYPPSSGLDAVGQNNYASLNLDAAPGESNDLGWAGPLETQESSELLIAWGFNGAHYPCCGVIAPGPGFTIRQSMEGGAFMLEDSLTNVPGLYIASVHWPGYAHWTLGVAAFKMRKP